VPVPIRLVVDLGPGARSIDISVPDVPAAGDVIVLQDGRRCLVRNVIAAPAENSAVSHYAYALRIVS
jgi:hypothetical protein